MSLINSITTTGYVSNVSTTGAENGIGHAIGRFLGRYIFGTLDAEYEPIATKQRAITQLNSTEVPFGPVFNQLFPKNLNLFYAELDPGPDDAMALNLLLAASKSTSNPSIGRRMIGLQALVASVGNAVLSQTEQNVQKLLQLAEAANVPAFAGARAPDGIQNDTQAIEALEKQINATHRYGRDGLEDVGGWPAVTVGLQQMPGYQRMVMAVLQATPDTAVTLVSTAGLTDLAQALKTLVEADPAGAFVPNINAIIIRGGCLNPGLECNAPPTKPDDKKDSELSFYFDVPSAQAVFSICQEYGIPVVLLPLSLTQQPGLLWTKKQQETLEAINSAVVAQLAKVTGVVPYLDARHFPAGTYPMHDLFAAAALLRPEFFVATKMAYSIGDSGSLIANATVAQDQQNVWVLSMPEAQQAAFYDTILKEYENFNCTGTATEDGCIPPDFWQLYLEIGIPVGVAVLGIVTTLAVCIIRSKKRQNALASEKTALLGKNRELNETAQTLKVTVDGMEQLIVGLRDEMGQPVLPEDHQGGEDVQREGAGEGED